MEELRGKGDIVDKIVAYVFVFSVIDLFLSLHERDPSQLFHHTDLVFYCAFCFSRRKLSSFLH